MGVRLRTLCFSSLLVVVIPLLLACSTNMAVFSDDNPGQEQTVMATYDPNQPVSSNEDAAQGSTVSATGEKMVIEGKIVEVMESWPLQLVVETQSGRYYVELVPETTIAQQGQKVDQGNLKAGLQVQLEGQRSGSSQLAMTAQVIEIK